MKTLDLLTLLLLSVLVLFVSSAFAADGVDNNDHAALAKYYENLTKEAATKLQENKEILEEYEAHPYYYGRQGQDLQSHTSANIHEYEEHVEENLHNAELHRKMVLEQDNPSNKVKINLEKNSIEVR